MNELIKRFAEVNNISEKEAQELVGGETDKEITQNISKYILTKINDNMPKLNREQRRKLAKKHQLENFNAEAIRETARKLNYIDLIQKIRELNKENEENGETATENDGHLQG